MQRKLVKQGGNTLMVSLPPTWLSKAHLKKGDDVTIFEQDEGIFITAKGTPTIQRLDIQLPEGKNFANRLLIVPYVQGVDEIHAACPDSLCIDKLMKIVQDRFIGMEVVDNKNGVCVIKNVAEGRETEFDALFRRTCFLFLEMLKEGVATISKKDFESLHKVSTIDYLVNKYSLFLQRLVNKYGYKPKKEEFVVSILLFVLESCSDLLADIYKEIASGKKVPDKSTLEYLSSILHVYDDLQAYFFKKSMENLMQLRKTTEKARSINDCTSYIHARLFCILEQISEASYLVG